MKKLFLSIFTLFLCSVFLVRVNADVTQYPPLFNVDYNDVDAKAPTTLPDEDKVYATMSGTFDLSKVIFTDSSGNNLPGKTDLEKIIIGSLNRSQITGNNDAKKSLDVLLQNWFTAYCLDANKKYPVFGLFNSGGYYDDEDNIGSGYSHAVKADGTYNDLSDPVALQQAIAMAAISNDPTFSAMLEDLTQIIPATYIQMPEESVEIVPLDDSQTIEDFYTYFMGQTNTKVAVGLRFIGFSNARNLSQEVYYAADSATYNDLVANHPDATVKYINGSAASGPIPLNDITNNTGTLADYAFQKYASTTSITSLPNYNHALWIVENSYPTLDVDDALSKAGVNVTTYENQIKTLYSLNDSQVSTYKKSVTYGIVQYAIWKVTGHQVDGETLGNKMANSTTSQSELNKLYTYLIDESRDYDGYADNRTFSKNITFTRPSGDDELHETTNSAFIYGPYSATYNAIVDSTAGITYNITSANSDDVKIVDSNKRELSSLAKDQQFYIMVPKDTPIGNVTIEFALSNVVTFSPATDRGRIYYPISSMSQNALIGGKTSLTTINGDLSVVTNAKTGVQNIALLLMVTLVAFTLGYLALSYKQKPIDLQQ